MQIKDLPATTTIDDNDLFVIQTSTGITKKITAANLKSYFGSGSSGGSTTQDTATQLKAITGFNLLLVSDAGVTVSGNDVTAWNDQSGTARNASSSSGYYPSLVGGGCPSGKPSIDFLGSKYLNLNNAVSGTAKTIWIACKNTSSDGNNSYMLGGQSGVLIFGYDDGLSASPRLYSGNSDYFSSTPYSSVKNVWKIFELNIDSSRNVTLNVNAIADAKTISSSADFSFDRISGYSGGRFLYGQIALIAATTTSLTSQQKQSIRSLIASYVGITL